MSCVRCSTKVSREELISTVLIPSGRGERSAGLGTSERMAPPGGMDEPKTLVLLPVDCRVRVLSLIDCPKATMRLCQTCRTFGDRVVATELWHGVLAQRWGVTGAQLWYDELVHRCIVDECISLPMLKSVRAFREASEAERESRAMPPRSLEHCLHEECVPVLLEEFRLVLEITYHGRCVLAQCVQCFEGMCNADRMGKSTNAWPDGAPMAFDTRARAVVFNTPRPPASWDAFVARLSVVAPDGTVTCLGESGEEAMDAMDAMDVEEMQQQPRLRQVFFDDFSLPVSTFPLAVCQEIRDGLHDLTNEEDPDNGNWDNELGEGRGLAVGIDVYLSAQIEPVPNTADAWRVSSFCIEPQPDIAYPGNSHFDYYNDESCQQRGHTKTDEMARCVLWEATNLGKHVGDAHQRWGGA